MRSIMAEEQYTTRIFYCEGSGQNESGPTTIEAPIYFRNFRISTSQPKRRDLLEFGCRSLGGKLSKARQLDHRERNFALTSLHP
jgi:hypothetical protein